MAVLENRHKPEDTDYLEKMFDKYKQARVIYTVPYEWQTKKKKERFNWYK